MPEDEGRKDIHRYKERHTTACGSRSYQTTHDDVEVTCVPCVDAMLRAVSIPAAGAGPVRPAVTLGMVPRHVLPAPAPAHMVATAQLPRRQAGAWHVRGLFAQQQAPRYRERVAARLARAARGGLMPVGEVLQVAIEEFAGALYANPHRHDAVRDASRRSKTLLPRNGWCWKPRSRRTQLMLAEGRYD